MNQKEQQQKQRANEMKGWFIEKRNKTDKLSQITQNKELRRILHIHNIWDEGETQQQTPVEFGAPSEHTLKTQILDKWKIYNKWMSSTCIWPTKTKPRLNK